jgi:hypothetical protein
VGFPLLSSLPSTPSHLVSTRRRVAVVVGRGLAPVITISSDPKKGRKTVG